MPHKLLLIFVLFPLLCRGFSLVTLMSGPPSDLGFNYMINEARVSVSKILNIEDSVFYVISGHNQTLSLITKLNAPNIIICSSQEHTSACKLAAGKYPNTIFAMRGSAVAAGNTVYYNDNYAGIIHTIGKGAGLQTKNNAIGFVSPGQFAMSDPFVFAFWLGAKSVNPGIKFYYYDINSFVNAEVTTAAVKDLVGRGCDVVGSLMDDNSANIAMMSMGFSALGTNGFPQKRIYGEKISYSYSYNWTKIFLPIVKAVMDGEKLVSGYGDFDNSFYNFEYSVFVDEYKISIINAEIKKLIDTPRADRPYYCNEYFTNYGIPPTRTDGNITCISSNNFFKILQPMPGMTYLGKYEIQKTKIEINLAIKYGFSILSGIFILAVIAGICGVIYHRGTSPIRAATPTFLIFILMGAICIYIAVIIWANNPDDALCNARMWLATLGFSILISSLVIKNFRIWLIFDNPKLKIHNIKNRHLYPWVGMCIIINIIFMSVMTSGLNAENIYTGNTYITVCKMSTLGSSALYGLLSYFGILLLVGLFISWKIRIVNIENFNESKIIAHTIYAISFCIFVIIPVLISPQTQSAETILLCTAGIFIVTAAMCIIFAPKFWNIWHGDEPVKKPGVTMQMKRECSFTDEE